jgi:hypothetical protein
MAQKGGRPKVTTDKVVSLLVTCFQNGLTVRQACWQSGISHEAYYQRLRNDSEFADKMSKAQQLPSITARTNVMSAIKKGDVSASKWLLERKDKEEFSSKTDVTVQQEVEVQSTEEKHEKVELTSRQLIVYHYKSRKMRLISNYCSFNGLDKDKYGALDKLYALSDDELFRLSVLDAANDKLNSPDVEGVFKTTPGLNKTQADFPLPPHVRRRSDVESRI